MVNRQLQYKMMGADYEFGEVPLNTDSYNKASFGIVSNILLQKI